ncbi:O-succinylbenzoate synthase [Scopulibacillus darangshiensis]|uniref:o-succinylbenzoate synthase n=1 Tax=Scopulibacillus darangshiensis TaxID=442528 RepID=A0A4R2PBJ2_9BACL|nr:o-succinylbenzoate synthase [Scopulibacillus darangshiensis]TCP31275.1 O-succinylbenzoate synthase [Scopulibacillus darangshiensis]
MAVIPLEKIILRKVKMRMKNPFTTSFGTLQDKEFFIVEAVNKEGQSGWGESVAFSAPWYTEETVKTNEHVIKDFLIPLLRKRPLEHPDEVSERFSPIRRNNMAKAALDGAIWDLYAKEQGLPLSLALGGEKKQIDVGISIGIQKDISLLLGKVGDAIAKGFKRIKIKIKPGFDVNVIKRVREAFPETPLMADANSAYTLKDIDHLKQLDHYNLMMIEQPLLHDDIVDHAALQKALTTPICLDESIHSLDDAKHAISLGSCKIINVKIGRVGGLTVAKQIHDYCRTKDMPVWCGGMLEAGVGRAHNIALTSLPQFILPGDTAGSSHYWERDIIEPKVIVRDGVIEVPQTPGIGYAIDQEALDAFTVSKDVFDV